MADAKLRPEITKLGIPDMRYDQQRKEAFYGAVVLFLVAAIMLFSYLGVGRHKTAGYDLTARFSKVEGVGIGSDVRLAGLKIGKVAGQSMDKNFRAILTFHLAPGTQLPIDSAALIQTDGVLGSKFVSIQPGGSDVLLKAGDEIKFTQDSMNVKELLSLVIARAEANRAGRNQETGGVVQGH